MYSVWVFVVRVDFLDGMMGYTSFERKEREKERERKEKKCVNELRKF